MKVNAYGRELLVEKEGGAWQVFDAGSEGKRRRAWDIRIPGETGPGEVVQYISDLLHEHATERHPGVYEHD